MSDRSCHDAESLFRAVALHYGYGVEGEALRRGKFGSSALKVEGKIFAALSGDKLLIKLPKERVDALVAAGIGKRFSTGATRVKKEWVTIAPSTQADWLALAEQARTYVGASAGRPR